LPTARRCFAPDAAVTVDLALEAAFRLGPVEVRPSTREVVSIGQRQVLEPRVMQLLVVLARRRGEVVSRDELAATCWAGRTVGEDAINRCIAGVRRLGEAYKAFALETIPRVGYRLVDAAVEAAAAAVPKLSICVLPFANMSDDPLQEYFSDGITEDIITDLAKVSALSVVARNTAFTFKGAPVDALRVAQQLNVGHLLEGSVRKVGNRVRITAQLIDGAAGYHVWAERYDGDLTDIFALQDEIAQAIVVALKLKLLPQEKQAIERRGTDSVDAYDLYLMARSHWLTGAAGDPQRDEAIERLSRRAVEIDPGYARAWALLALGQYNLNGTHARPGDGGQAALDRALALDPDLAEARAQKAWLLAQGGRPDEAATEIAVALRLDPESFEVNYRAARISHHQGRLEDAIHHFEKATALAQTSLKAPHMLISCYTALGDGDNTRRIAGIALERAEKAVVQDRSNGSAMVAGVSALAALGERERAKDWLRRALLIDPDNLIMRYSFACTLATSLDVPEAALNMLGPVLERDTGRLVRAALTDPDLAGLHDDPRFQAMVAAAQARLAAGEAGSPPAT
jgi:adenylate cyclase